MSTREIVIQGVTVPVTMPYAEGHVLTAGEAKALNQVRAENIRNNMATQFKKLQGEDGTYSPEALQKAAEIVSTYDAEYVFTLTTSGGGRKALDPLEKECIAIVRAQISAQIKAKGLKIKDVPAEKIEELIEANKDNEKVVALAKKRLKEREGLAAAVDFDL